MTWLLKITDGPMRGAEIALVNGMRLKVGSGADCDIVVADASLGATAFTLDVADAAVTLVTPDGDARVMNSFETHGFGTSVFAVGPAEGVWEELRPAAAKAEAAAAEPTAPADGASAAEPAKPAEETPAPRRRRSCFSCLLAALILLLLAVLGWLLWARGHVDAASLWKRGVAIWQNRSEAVEKPQSAVPAAKAESASVDEIIRANALTVVETNGAKVVTGNLKRRTERLALRALLQAKDRGCKLDLTDDETLAEGVASMLGMIVEDAVRLAFATNRVVGLKGYAASEEQLEELTRALLADVPGISQIDATQVQVGGLPVAVPTTTSSAAVKRPVAEKAEVVLQKEGNGKEQRPAIVAKPSVRLPVAGVLTRPYPCIVMPDGHRLVEGAQFGTATIVKIEAERVTLRENGRLVVWEI